MYPPGTTHGVCLQTKMHHYTLILHLRCPVLMDYDAYVDNDLYDSFQLTPPLCLNGNPDHASSARLLENTSAVSAVLLQNTLVSRFFGWSSDKPMSDWRGVRWKSESQLQLYLVSARSVLCQDRLHVPNCLHELLLTKINMTCEELSGLLPCLPDHLAILNVDNNDIRTFPVPPRTASPTVIASRSLFPRGLRCLSMKKNHLLPPRQPVYFHKGLRCLDLSCNPTLTDCSHLCYPINWKPFGVQK